MRRMLIGAALGLAVLTGVLRAQAPPKRTTSPPAKRQATPKASPRGPARPEPRAVVPPPAAVGKTVADYGAVPDDDGEDTAAFQTAIADGVFKVPAGTYLIRSGGTLNRCTWPELPPAAPAGAPGGAINREVEAHFRAKGLPVPPRGPGEVGASRGKRP
jgi:hypothetical protein